MSNIINIVSAALSEKEPARSWHPLAFEADWKSMVLVHFAIAPELLESYLPLPLDLYRGEAYVSLVFFDFEQFRPAGSGRLGQCLCRALSGHPFLNLRTYVRSSAGPGIFFIAEWITNRLSRYLGPVTHGLPYRLGTFQMEENRPGGTDGLSLTDRDGQGEIRLTYPSHRDKPQAAADGSLDAFLLERYTAYTERRGVVRSFEVSHTPWIFERPDWIRIDTPLLSQKFPWFANARLMGAHTSKGFESVYMGPPRVLSNQRASLNAYTNFSSTAGPNVH